MSNLNLWLIDNIEIGKVGDPSEFGVHKVEEIIKTKARVEDQDKLVMDAKGRDVVITATIYMGPNEDVKVEDKITVLDENDTGISKEYTVVSTILERDNKGRSRLLEVFVR